MSHAVTRGTDGEIIVPSLHVPPVRISSPYVPHPLQILGHIPLPVHVPQPVAGKVTPSLAALARTNGFLPFTFNGFSPR